LKELITLEPESFWEMANFKLEAIRAARSLKNMGLTHHLLSCLEDKFAPVNLEASAVLAFSGNNIGKKMLKEFSCHNDIRLRLSALTFLSQIEGEKWVKKIHQVTQKEIWKRDNRQIIPQEERFKLALYPIPYIQKMRAYESIGSPEAVRGLKKIFRNDCSLMAAQALYRLEKLEDFRLVRKVVKNIEYPHAKLTAVPILIAYNQALAFTLCEEVYKKGWWWIDEDVIRAIALHGDGRFLPLLEDFLEIEENWMRSDAARAILCILNRMHA